ncbi:uncharacterized protein FOMMEDRAFT_153719 [Fomitiporia mediterranea MF3/22]|uniref:uncharacterized protein n=1 Tax=Fomitiporia mediterranea (strain MF3/22) TaxID=694068 RepID=UPI00044080B4|nr:uncharacterized protein FOMMEDRAFT_153719 [Fomitiporia mediterranea MF3/22]EJD06293.1 hypothetical protein FOMMEDRAFT_153719 [Fomitiporia mediterranea MF3/22]
MPALSLRSRDDATELTTPSFIVKLQATVDKRALAAIPTYDHSHGTTLSLTLYALSFPTHSMLNITLYRSTPRAFTFPSAADNTISNGSSGPPLTPLELSPSIRSTSPSLFELPESTRSTLRISTCMHYSHSLHAVTPQPPQPARPHPTHTRNLTHRSRVTTNRSDKDYIKRPEDAFILFRHKFYSRKNKAEAAGGAEVRTVEIMYHLLFCIK